MSQINYNVKIMEMLLKRENHVRGLAKELHTNQTTVARKLQELYEENVVDFNMEGRNKVFYVKKSMEAKQAAYLVEVQRLQEAIKKYPLLSLLVERVRRNPDIHLAIIFGSYAKGTAHKKSDIDLYVETNDMKLKSAIELLDSKLSVQIGRFDTKSLLIREIEKNHLIVKGIEEYTEKCSFFEAI